MDFQERYLKHKTFIENRWQPIDVKVLSEEDPKKKESIIIEAKNKSAHSGIFRYKKTQDSSAHLLLP